MRSKKVNPKVNDQEKRVWKSQRREVIRRSLGEIAGGAVAGPIGAVVGAIAHPLGFAAGYLDEIRVWSKALSAVKVAYAAHGIISSFRTNLAGYWNFEDGTATDLSGNGHGGKFYGGSVVSSGDWLVSGFHFDSPVQQGAGLGRFRIEGSRGFQYRIDSSENLADWSPVMTATTTNGVIEFIKTAPPK